MDIFNVMNKAKELGRYVLTIAIVLNFLPLVFAGGGESIVTALTDMCELALQILGIGIILMIVLAGTIYAVGQIMGAETRARASVWATAMITGAVIGALIYLLVPWILATVLNTTSTGGCNFTIE